MERDRLIAYEQLCFRPVVSGAPDLEDSDECSARLSSFVHLNDLCQSIAALTPLQVLLILMATTFVISGNGGQLLSLNLWVNHFPANVPPPYSILTLSAVTISAAFLIAMVVRILLVRPRLTFLLSKKGLLLALLIGLSNSLNGVLLVFATPSTPEILQALLLCSSIFWTLLFSTVMLKDRRRVFTSVLVGLSFLLCSGGIVLGASPQFGGSSMASDKVYWTLIFAASMIPGALYNVFASMYMRSFTAPHRPKINDRGEDEAASPTDINPGGYYSAGVVIPRFSEPVADSCQSDDATVKLVMLGITGVSQVFWIFALLPLDSVPWFGGSSSIRGTIDNLREGWDCVLRGDSGCSETYKYYVIFCTSYFMNYLGSSYLNHYSATLNSMVTQLSSPVAAIVLLVAPALNVDAQPLDAGSSIGAVMLLVAGALIFSIWEQGTRKNR